MPVGNGRFALKMFLVTILLNMWVIINPMSHLGDLY